MLKELKSPLHEINPPLIDKIKYFSRLQYFWKYCKTNFEPKSDKVLPNCSKSDFQQYFERVLAKGRKNDFRIPE